MALRQVCHIMKTMNKDVKEWVSLTKRQKVIGADISSGVARAIDFEAKMKLHNNNLKDRLLVLILETEGRLHADVQGNHVAVVKKIEGTQEIIKKASGETRMIVRETSAETNGLVQEAIEVAEDTRKVAEDTRKVAEDTRKVAEDTRKVAEDTRKKMDDSFEKTQEL
eukprot:scaffold157_cov183-Pinguiococcus_pyrenoidosus.AAC.1